MITLYTFGPAFGLPDPSPFVTKAEVLLKMAGLAYRIDNTGFRRSPKGKLPYIDDDGERIADSTFIRWHLENKYHIDFEKGLSAEQRAVGWAFEKMAEDNLYWARVEARWFDETNFAKGPREFFSHWTLIRRAASQSRSAGDTGRAGSGIGLSSATGRPWRVMTTPSPFKARSMSSGSRFFASATLSRSVP
jgi:hypothetical protein